MPKPLFKTKVPLLNGGKRVVPEEVTKPDRTLGGSYISDKVAVGGSVKLCDDCIQKYYGFWKDSEHGHRPNWGYYFTSTCDGCNERYSQVILFLKESSFYKVLADNHGKASGPRRKIFRFPWR